MAELTRRFAEERGEQFALIDDHHRLSWADLDEQVNRCVHGLRSLGLGPGDTVSIVAGNRNEWFVVSLACAHAGITFVPVNWHLVAPELAYIFNDSNSSAVFVGHRYVDVVAQALANNQCPDVAHAVAFVDPESGMADERFRSYAELLDQPSGEPREQIMGGPMFYTSGTTGNPKGVRRASYGGAEQSPALWRKTSHSFSALVPVNGTTLLCGPVYHSAQWAFSWMPLTTGSNVVMQHKYDSAGVLELVDTHGATNVHLVPTQMKRLLDLPTDVKAAYDGSSMAAVIHGAAPCPPLVKQRLIDWWGPVITEYYGSTEGSVLTLISSDEWLERGGSVGRPVPSAELFIVDDDHHQCPPNQSGTIYFRSARGGFRYHNAPEKTASAHLSDDVATTGDVGYLDDDGYLWLSDRKIDMIISGGVNIYPAEIEGVLGGHPHVADVAVIGVPNEEFGEEVKAIIVTDATSPELVETLIGYCREHLAGYKVPRSIDIVDALPRTGTGKVQKRKLREQYW